jgi:hypothetical protein
VKRQILYLMIILCTLLAACASPASLETPTAVPATETPNPSRTPQATLAPTQLEPTPIPSPTHLPVDVPPAQRAAVQALADALGIDAGQVKLVSIEAVDWPNGCLGVQRIGVMCTQQIVPGFRIILETNGQQYEYHTNSSGSELVPAEGQQPIPISNDAVQSATRDLAAALKISPDQVSLISAAIIEWPDSCLGIQQTNIACAEMVTPGYLIVLEAQGRQYEYHTDAAGNQIIPATLGLSWTRQGGLAGFCDQLEVFLPNKANAASCKSQGNASTADLSGLLSAGEMEQFNQWLDDFSTVTLTQKDPAVTDAMTQTLLLQGFGQEQPSTAQQQAMFDWAQKVFGKTHP